MTTSKAALICSELWRRHAWVATGTPINAKPQELHGLLAFLGTSPFKDEGAFNALPLNDYKRRKPNALYRMRTLLRELCLRRSKADPGAAWSWSCADGASSRTPVIKFMALTDDEGCSEIPTLSLPLRVRSASSSGGNFRKRAAKVNNVSEEDIDRYGSLGTFLQKATFLSSVFQKGTFLKKLPF